MNRPYLILLFAAAVFLVLVGWMLYGKFVAPPAPAATSDEPATQPLVERLRAERERRMRERGAWPANPSPSTRPATAPAAGSA